MSKVVIHIGTHKTATTTIQNIFWSNHDKLAEHGLIYPRIGEKIPGHHGLVFYWKHMPAPYQLPKGSRAGLKDIADTYANKDVTVFLSSEEFSRVGVGDQPENSFIELRELLSGFDEIEVVCVLRTQWQFLQSAYMEISKKNCPPRPSALVAPTMSSGAFQGLWVDYNPLLTKLEEAFEPHEITLLDFDVCRRSKDGILGYFLRHLGVDIDIEDLAMQHGSVWNSSSLSLAGWVANLLSEPRVAPPHLIKRIERLLRAEFGDDVRPCIFSHDEFNRLSTHFEAKNRTLEARRAAVQPDFAVTRADPETITLFKNQINNTFWIRICRDLVKDPL
ncbi:MAG: hypothetical protein QM492_01005 [Rhodobacterales bacterium]